MSKQPPFAHGLRACIFCGKAGRLTKEDVFPTWMQPYINLRQPAHFYQHVSTGKVGQPNFIRLKKRSGDPNVMRIKVVCRGCNTGWMSRLQQLTKPILLPMIKGETRVLGRRERELLSRWIAMAVMVSEFFDKTEEVVTPQSERTALFQRQEISKSTWRIWIGRYQRNKFAGRWMHSTVPFEDQATDNRSAPRMNARTTTLVMGQLYMHAISSKFEDIVSHWNYGPIGEQRLAQLWPLTPAGIIWPWNSMTDNDAINIARTFFDFWDGWARSHGA